MTIIRQRFHFEHIFRRFDTQDAVMQAIRRSLSANLRPFNLCSKCYFFQIKGFNGEAWYENNKNHSELRQVLSILRLIIPELVDKNIENLSDVIICEPCKDKTK